MITLREGSFTISLAVIASFTPEMVTHGLVEKFFSFQSYWLSRNNLAALKPSPCLITNLCCGIVNMRVMLLIKLCQPLYGFIWDSWYLSVFSNILHHNLLCENISVKMTAITNYKCVCICVRKKLIFNVILTEIMHVHNLKGRLMVPYATPP